MQKIPDFVVSKPIPSLGVFFIGFMVCVGLVALFLAAFSAFLTITPWFQAMAAALLIEAGMVSESIALIRNKNWFAALGLFISLAVSGSYNFIQASQAAGSNINQFLVFMLALGPLSALTFLSMALGKELRSYERSVELWNQRKQAHFDKWQNRLNKSQEKLSQVTDESFIQVSDNLHKSSYTDWRTVPKEVRQRVFNMEIDDIQKDFGLIYRTAYNWKKNAEEEFKEK